MIIVKIHCGLGNQMFQYALYRQLKEINNDNVKLHYMQYGIDYIFDNIKNDVATAEEVKRIKRNKKNMLIFNPLQYNEEIINVKNKYLSGYWQSELYFKDIFDILKHEFKFRAFDDENNIKMKELCESTNSVGIHVRRGDYVGALNYKDICTEQYYDEAINLIRKNVANPLFIVFSNDIDWCREKFKNENFIFVDYNTHENSYKDMQLMSCCKHNIIANSTFSWWGAWLNDNPDKIVIAPKKWINLEDANPEDIIPKSWIKL